MRAGTGHPPSRARRTGLWLIAAALIATLAVPMLLGGRDALLETVRLPVQGYFTILLAIALSWIARAFKLNLLLRRLNVHTGIGHALGIALASDFAFIATPAGVGGYAASVYYLRRAGATTSAAATITAVDQALDLLFFALALPLAGLAIFGSNLPRALTTAAFGAGVLMFVLALVVVLARRRLFDWLFSDNGLTARWPALRRLQNALRELIANLREDARVLLAGGPAFLLALALTTILQWLGRYGVFWLALVALGQRLPFAFVLIVQTLVLHAAQWTGVPSGGGGAELGLTATLAAWVPATDLASALLLWRMATFYLCLLAGLVAIAVLARTRRVSATQIDAGANLGLDTI